MPQIFHPSTNTIARVSLFGALFLVGGVLWVLVSVQRSSYVTRRGVPRTQPVPFSHQHHVGGVGLDCRFCHTSVETSAFAGIPPTQTCMICHSRLWSDSPTLAPVRESLRTGVSLQWNRVHNLADFVYFDHSVHVAKGVACLTCHGHVDQMPLIYKSVSLQMEWCLACHRQPEKYLTPREAVFRMDDPAPEPESKSGAELVKEYGVRTRTDCSTCHH
jgi:cytochrome c7-like protein